MNSFEANIRNSNTKGEVNKLRNTGFIPCILYGGKEANQKLSINKKLIIARLGLKCLLQIHHNLKILIEHLHCHPAHLIN